MDGKVGVGTLCTLVALVAILLLAIGFSIVGWNSADDDMGGGAMSSSGYIAMIFGITVTLALGFGLMSLVFYSGRTGHDRDADPHRDR